MGKTKQNLKLEFRHQNNYNKKRKVKSNKKKKRQQSHNAYNDLFWWGREIRMLYNYHCVICNKASKLSAHHIFSKSKYPGLKFNIDNGILMCRNCHIELHQLNDVIIASSKN